MSKNKLSTEPYKGVRDFYPPDQALLNYILSMWRSTSESFGYVEYGASILEPSDLYKAKGVENEEIVSEQTYTFTDRGGREVTLRPEMTPTVARMVAGKRRDLAFPLRWYSTPNCFRYERPQRGRLREFWQLNADILGSTSLAADAEIMELASALMRAFGASEGDFEIRVGSRAFVDALAARKGLSDGQKQALVGLLDRKQKISGDEYAAGLANVGISPQELEGDVPEDVQHVLEMLEARDIRNAVWDPSVVRGFAYYTGVVFEVFDTHPDNNRALFGGGRYDKLTELFDNEALPGVGFGMGDETIRLFLESRGLLPQYLPPTQVYLALADQSLLPQAALLAQELRAAGVRVALDFGEKKLGRQIEVAAKHGIPYLIVVGPDELMARAFGVKDLMTGDERHMGREELAAFFTSLTL